MLIKSSVPEVSIIHLIDQPRTTNNLVLDRPSCRNCAISDGECEYPGRDRVVTVQESDIIRLQKRIAELERELDKADAMELKSDDPGFILQENVFHTSTTTDSSLYSFLDIDGEDDIVSAGNTLRYFYVDPSDHGPITGIVTLPDRGDALFLVERVIKFLGQEYYLFPLTLMDDISDLYSQNKRRNDPGWMAFFFITLAIGQQYLNEASLTTEVPGISYFNIAVKLMKMQFEEPSLRHIQTLLLIGFYQQGLNRSNTAFAYYGLAVRSSLSMGLHRKMKSLPLEEQEQRRRLWWTCFCMDTVWTAKLGQPTHVEIFDATVSTKQITTLNDRFNIDILESNVQLSVITGEVMRTIYRPTTKKTISDLLKSLSKLGSFQQNLPPKFKTDIIVPNDRTNANLYLRLNQIVIITIRPLVLSVFIGQQESNDKSSEINQAIKRCVKAACTNINILQHLRDVGMFSNYGFWDARYLFSSLLVLYMSSSGENNLIQTGRKLNKVMGDAGNFTAIENEIRLQELDTLFTKIHDQSREEVKNEKSAAISPNTLLLDEISNTFSLEGLDDDQEFAKLFQSLSKELSPDVLKNLTTNLKSWDSTGYI